MYIYLPVIQSNEIQQIRSVYMNAHKYNSIQYVAETWTECGIISSCPTSQLWFEGRVLFFLSYKTEIAI